MHIVRTLAVVAFGVAAVAALAACGTSDPTAAPVAASSPAASPTPTASPSPSEAPVAEDSRTLDSFRVAWERGMTAEDHRLICAMFADDPDASVAFYVSQGWDADTIRAALGEACG